MTHKSKNSRKSKHRDRYMFSDSDRSDPQTLRVLLVKKDKKKSKKCGMSKRASDNVKHPQIWPHSVLQYEFVSDHVFFTKSDFKMFLCGELEILTSRISKSEFKGRIYFLK